MKIKVPGIVIFFSSFFYLLDIIFQLIAGWGFSAPTMLISFFSVGLLIGAAIASSKKNLMLILIGVFVLINIFDALFFNWYMSGRFFGILSTFLPLNYLIGYGRFFAIFADIHVILLIVGVILTLVSKESEKPVHQITHTNQPQMTQQPVARSSVSIEGDAVVQVQKLGELLKQGLITQEEFDRKKKQILGL